MTRTMSTIHPFVLSLFFLSLGTFFLISRADVPVPRTFKLVNEGKLERHINEDGVDVVEYSADYRPLGLFTFPFQLCFYNTTDNAYTLALRMGTRPHLESKWVWEANRGKPVRENATLALGSDGNLVLADHDGQIIWQTGTANKGVVGFQLLPNGNMVLYDNKNNYLWQSFDYPTDTLLMGQSFRSGVLTKIVSRASIRSNHDGPYSFELEPTKGLAMYYKSANSVKPMVYFSTTKWFTLRDFNATSMENATFTYVAANDSELAFKYGLKSTSHDVLNMILAWPKYNGTLSYLRLGIDGNLRIFTYAPHIRNDYWSWENTFTMFADGSYDNECQLPERCGKFGLCEDEQCVACPSPSGVLGWDKSCEPVKVHSCKPSDFKYYKINGVDHFMSKYTRGYGPITEEACGRICTEDCKCMGYFYHKDTSRCWIAYDLKTLSKVSNSSHVAYIKTPVARAI